MTSRRPEPTVAGGQSLTKGQIYEINKKVHVQPQANRLSAQAALGTHGFAVAQPKVREAPAAYIHTLSLSLYIYIYKSLSLSISLSLYIYIYMYTYTYIYTYT